MKARKYSAVYCRVSSREQAMEGFSLRNQEDVIRKHIEMKKDNTKILLYLDEGKSAKDLNRPGMRAMIEDIKLNMIDTLWVQRLDRLTRSVKDLLDLVDTFEKHNVSLVSLYENFDMNTAMGRMMVGIIIKMAQWEREMVRVRTINGMDQSAQEGNYALGGKPPFGYDRTAKNKLKPNSDGREWIPVIFNKIVEEDYSVLRLTYYLNNQNAGLTKWNETKVRKVLTNSIYYGTFKNGRVIIDKHTDPLISKELYNKANIKLRKRSKNTRYKYLIKNL